MKNSAWYHKLWRDKLDKLPLKKDDDAAWADMRKLLDEQLPDNSSSVGKNAYKLSTLTKTILLLVTIAIITISAILQINKHNTPLFKNSKRPSGHTTLHNTPNILSNKSSNQNSNSLIVADSNYHQSGSFAGDVNQKVTSHSSVISNKSAIINQSLQPLNATGLKTNAKQHQTDNKAKNDELLNTSLVTLQLNLSKQGVTKSSNRHSGILTNGYKQKNHQVLISKHSPSTNYISTKAGPDKAAKNGRYTTPVNDITGKAIVSNNITAELSKSAKPNNDKEAADTKIDPVKKPANNADGKEVKSYGSKSRIFNTGQKTVKSKDNKTKSNTKKPKTDDMPPKYSYGLNVGYNAGHSHNLYAGIFGSYRVKQNWLINLGLRLNTYTTVSGEYSHQSYYSPDSIPAFKISDSRRVMALTIPVTLEYKLSKNISLKAGPVLSMQIKQSGVSTKLGAVPNTRDTVYHTRMIDSTLQKTTINKLNIGFTGGVSIQIKHFNIEAMYQVLTPYKVSSGLGSYQKNNQNFQIGIGYRFK